METDFRRFLQALRLPQIKDVCVLIDHCTVSRTVSAAYQIKQELEKVTLILFPGGEENANQVRPAAPKNIIRTSFVPRERLVRIIFEWFDRRIAS